MEDQPYGPSTYSGAPDECSIHWSTKLAGGFCTVKDCPYGWEAFEALSSTQNFLNNSQPTHP